ncbi:muramidase family protein [Microbacterium gilvum]|uniref:LysM domain-containing protein n=1 Tax=Microbacterium gilvum TaxID=1336204 RepID=A0ABP8ZQG8_9MICO
MHRPSPRRRRDLLTAVPVAVTGALAVTIAAPAAAVAAEPKPRETGRQLPSAFGHTVGALALATVAKSVPAAVSSAPSTYTVAAGDTITGIAIRHGLRTIDVLTWNGLSWSSTIYPGQKLALAASGTATAQAAPVAELSVSTETNRTTHTVEAGDTVWSIAQRYDVPVADVLSLNSLSSDAVIFPGQKLVVAGAVVVKQPAQPVQEAQAPAPSPSASDETYIVQAGDTPWSIADEHGVSVSELLAANGLGGSSIIYPGQKIVIPSADAPAPAAADTETPSTGSIYDSPEDQLWLALNAPQTENAQMIIRIGRELGVSDRGIAIALATAMVESSLRNVSWGDRDSLGLFQQRPSTGWGTEEQILDRDYAIRVFFGGPGDPNGSATRGLLDLSDWAGMEFGAAAQAVQISAFPDRYGRWEKAAYTWLSQLG